MDPSASRHDIPLMGSPGLPQYTQEGHGRSCQQPMERKRQKGQQRRRLHPAGEEHGASAGTQPKLKTSLDLHQGATGLTALEPQIHCLSQTPCPQELAGIASLSSPGSEAGLAACWGGACPYTLPFSNKPTINLMEGQ